MRHHEFLAGLAQRNDRRIVLLVLDGVGDLRTATQPKTALEQARTPNMDRLAERSSLGRLLPVAPGVTPGSGPGHLGLFGYDPQSAEADIGRGVLEALGLEIEIDSQDVVARGNFATADPQGNLSDRRAGRIPSDESRRVCARLQQALDGLEGVDARVFAGESHRFVLRLRGTNLSAELADTDPQRIGVPPRPPEALNPGADPQAGKTLALLESTIQCMEQAIAAEPRANRILLRGFSKLPHLPQFVDLYGVSAGAFAGYPLYRGVAAACGMAVVPCGKSFSEVVEAVRQQWDEFHYFFLHVKQTDAAGEDGDLAAKAAVLEQVDEALPQLLDLAPDVLAITGDHSTPAPMAAHSWHPVPLLLHSRHAFIDKTTTFDETAAIAGHLGTLRSYELMGLLLGHAGKLKKFGA